MVGEHHQLDCDITEPKPSNSILAAVVASSSQSSPATPVFTKKPVNRLAVVQGNTLRAFCGGVKKDALGHWQKGQTVFDHVGDPIFTTSVY